MGHGSSARPKVHAINEVSTFDARANEAQNGLKEQQRFTDEARWLRTIIEKEKAEKEWLMLRFERAERELVARSEEADRLRLQLSTFNTGTSHPSAMKLDGLGPAAAPDVTAPIPLRQLGVAATSPGVGPLSPTLKERRGGAGLSISTGSVTPKPAGNIAITPQPEPSRVSSKNSNDERSQKLSLGEKVPAPQSRSEIFLASLNSKEQLLQSGGMVEPMTAKATVGARSWLEEPMSPLLKRRILQKGGVVSQDYEEGGRRKNKKKLDPAKFATSDGTTGAADMRVQTPKIFNLSEPMTPKRVPMTPATARKRQETIWSQPIEESCDELEP